MSRGRGDADALGPLAAAPSALAQEGLPRGGRGAPQLPRRLLPTEAGERERQRRKVEREREV